jgi:hypothetical protein
MKKLNLKGQRFGRLTVLGEAGITKWQNVIWLCECSCGNRIATSGGRLRSGETQSCGCRRAIHGHCSLTSPDGASPTYKSWQMMKERCTNPSAPNYATYGEAGVTVCERWLNFESFFADMGERPEGTTLGRFLDTGSYEPGNCAWMTSQEQGLARRNKQALVKWQEVGAA